MTRNGRGRPDRTELSLNALAALLFSLPNTIIERPDAKRSNCKVPDCERRLDVDQIISDTYVSIISFDCSERTGFATLVLKVIVQNVVPAQREKNG